MIKLFSSDTLENSNSFYLYVKHIHDSIAQYGMGIFSIYHPFHEQFKEELFSREQSVNFMILSKKNKKINSYIQSILMINEETVQDIIKHKNSEDSVVCKLKLNLIDLLK